MHFIQLISSPCVIATNVSWDCAVSALICFDVSFQWGSSLSPSFHPASPLPSFTAEPSPCCRLHFFSLLLSCDIISLFSLSSSSNLCLSTEISADSFLFSFCLFHFEGPSNFHSCTLHIFIPSSV